LNAADAANLEEERSMHLKPSHCASALALGVAACGAGSSTGTAWADAGGDPWADRVVDFDSGANADPGFPDPSTALGAPERFTGEGSPFPGVVSIFSPPFGTDEIVSVGEGGALTVAFDEPIVDDPTHPFGVDLIVLGNGGFIDTAFPNGQIGDPPGTFGMDPMTVLVSQDGVTFVSLGEFTEGLFPTQGYLDSGPFDATPGTDPTDFTRPVDPSLTLDDFAGLTLAGALALYDGSGGGTPIDVGGTGLSEVNFVRIENRTPGVTVEIDAFAAVPEPATAGLLAAVAGAALRRRG
jgi:hypothetical protein